MSKIIRKKIVIFISVFGFIPFEYLMYLVGSGLNPESNVAPLLYLLLGLPVYAIILLIFLMVYLMFEMGLDLID